jgi:integrase
VQSDRRQTAPLVKVAENLYKRGDRLYLKAKIAQRQIVEPLGIISLAEAKRLRDKRLSDLRGKGGEEIDAVRKARQVKFDTLADKWLAHERGRGGSMKPSTIALRETLLRVHVRPVLGQLKVGEITAPTLVRLRNRLTGQGLSGSSVRGIFASVSCVLRHGVEIGDVTTNVCRDVQLPDGSRQTEPRYLTTEEIESLFDGLGSEFKVIAQTLYYAGLRVSEATSLRWSDIDFDAGLLYVRDGKTRASNTSVALLPELREILFAHRQDAVSRGQFSLDRQSLVFQTASGAAQDRRNVLRAINTASTKAGLDETLVVNGEEKVNHVGPHDLRHSLAAFAFDSKLEDVEVARLLRHASPAVTLQVYASISGKADQQALKVGERLAQARARRAS